MIGLSWDHEGNRGFGTQHALGFGVLVAVAFLVLIRLAFKNG